MSWLDGVRVDSTKAVGGEATDEAVEQFAAEHTGNAQPWHLAEYIMPTLLNANGDGTRNPTRDALCEAARDARVGWCCWETAKAEIEAAARDSYAQRGKAFDAKDFERSVKYAVGEANAEDMTALEARYAKTLAKQQKRQDGMSRTERALAPGGWAGKLMAACEPEQPTDDELEAFWNSCPELRDMRQFARSRRVGPWAMFGVCAAVVVSAVPPYVVLPPLVGRVASLNTFVALVGKSGSIKSAAIGAALDWLGVDPAPNPKKPGSGEGLAKCFAYVKKPKGEPAIQIGKHWSVLAEIPEVDTLTSTGGRGGSTLMSELRYAWSGERLGIDYAADDKAIVLQSQRYRLCMVVGVQPLRAAPIFDDADAGTPQRYVWFPVSDPNRPEERPAEPARLDLPPWPGLRSNCFDDDAESGGVLDFGRDMKLANEMNQPADPDTFEVMFVPDAVCKAIDEQAFAVLGDQDDIDPLDGHKLLCREKLAAAIAILCQRKEITEQDWELAGTAMKVSDLTRAEALKTLDAEAGRA